VWAQPTETVLPPGGRVRLSIGAAISLRKTAAPNRAPDNRRSANRRATPARQGGWCSAGRTPREERHATPRRLCLHEGTECLSCNGPAMDPYGRRTALWEGQERVLYSRVVSPQRGRVGDALQRCGRGGTGLGPAPPRGAPGLCLIHVPK
jgi:hypothetical protein